MHRPWLRCRLGLIVVGTLAGSSGCGTEPAVRHDPPDRPTQNASVIEPPTVAPPPPVAPAGIDPPTLRAVVSRPYCCDSNERIFDARIDEESLVEGLTCRWEFGDGYGSGDCYVRHRFPWAGSYRTTLKATLSDGEELGTAVEVTIGTIDGGAGSGGSSNGVEEGGDAPEDPPPPPPDDVETPGVEPILPGPVGATWIQVNTGPDIEVSSGQSVQLSGALTVEPATATIKVAWEQREGPHVEVSGGDTAGAMFTSPVVDLPTVLSFVLTATSGRVVASDFVAVTVLPPSDAVRADDPRFGYDASDATGAIQSAIDSGAATVIIPEIGGPWIVRPLALRSGLRLVLEPGVVLEAKEGEFRGLYDNLLSGSDVSNVIIEGYGATLRMRKGDYAVGAYARSEWRHGLHLQGAVNVQVLGLRIEQSGGDGIAIEYTSDRRRIPCRDVVVRDCVCADSYRNGISIVSGRNILVENCTITGTSGTAPQAGVVLEPDDHGDKLVNVRVRNCIAAGNVGSGFVTNLSRLDARSEPAGAVFENCVVQDSIQAGLRAILREDTGATGTLEFLNCQVFNNQLSGAKVLWDVRSAVTLRFTGCSWTDVALRYGEPLLDFELTGAGGATPGGGVYFTEGTVQNGRQRDPLRVAPADGAVYPEVTGHVSVYGVFPTGASFPQLPNLQVIPGNGGR